MLKIALLVGFLSSVRWVCALERLPNVRYIGIGYNAVKGNPENHLYDPGFTVDVLNLTWSSAATSTDGKYLVPDHVEAIVENSRVYDGSVSKEYGSSSYQDSISIGVTVEARFKNSIWNARFSASTGYQKIAKSSQQFRRFYTSKKGECHEYVVATNYVDAPIGVTSEFTRAVNDLPLEDNEDAYYNFINIFGTHFTTKVTLGAKMVIRSEFEQLAYTKMKKENVNVNIGASVSFGHYAEASASTDVDTSETNRKAFEETRRSYSASYLGRIPPKDDKWTTWSQSVDGYSYPVRYTLVPLTELFTNQFFPDLSVDDLEIKRDQLDSAYSFYCDGIPGCGIPPADRDPIMLQRIVGIFNPTTTLPCPTDMNLLSCGIENFVNSTDVDMHRYAIPVDGAKPSCNCSDIAGATCVAWCTNAAVQFKTAKNDTVFDKKTGIIFVACPEGYKV